MMLLRILRKFVRFFHLTLDLRLKEFLVDYRKKRLNEKKIFLRAIVPDNPASRGFFSDVRIPLTEVLYIDPQEFSDMFEHQINIYGNKISIIHLVKGAEYGVVINNPEIAGMHRNIFEIIWKKALSA